jgi:hypothetical protein
MLADLDGDLMLEDVDDPSRQTLPEDRRIEAFNECGKHDLTRSVARFCESTLNRTFSRHPWATWVSVHTQHDPVIRSGVLFGDGVRSVLRALEGKSTNLDTTTEGNAGKEIVRQRLVEVGSSSVHGIMQGEPIDRYDEKRRTTLLMQMKVAASIEIPGLCTYSSPMIPCIYV